MKVGDKLKQADGTLGEVRYVNTIQEARTMYNLEVQEAHTFFVGTQGWLVHNQKAKKCSLDLTAHRRQHILAQHKAGAGKSFGGIPKDEFPASWSDDDIVTAVSDLATDPRAFQGTAKYGRCVKGVVNGILMRVDYFPDNHPKYPGWISTGFPIQPGSAGDIGCQ